MTGLEVDLAARVGGFSLEVAFRTDAEVTALVGASGAGKTLTLRAIAGLLRPTSGRITAAGRVLFDAPTGVDLPARARRIGFVFQHYALFPHLDVAANVAYGLAGWDRPAARARVAELLALVDLAGRERMRPAELSGGQQQRVALARALAPRPELLLLDEPFSAADPRLRQHLRHELATLRARAGVPALIVTHDLADARALARRVVVLDHGRVVARGGPELLAQASWGA